MSKPARVPASAEPEQPDQVDPETARILAERLETFAEDVKSARPWEEVLADLKARRPLPPR